MHVSFSSAFQAVSFPPSVTQQPFLRQSVPDTVQRARDKITRQTGTCSGGIFGNTDIIQITTLKFSHDKHYKVLYLHKVEMLEFDF